MLMVQILQTLVIIVAGQYCLLGLFQESIVMGVLFVPIGSQFDETILNRISISPTVTYASNLDELTLQGQNVEKRENSDGTLMVNGYFDEVTGIL